METNAYHGAPTSSPSLPFLEGDELAAPSSDGYSEPNNLERQLYISASGYSEDELVSDGKQSLEGETHEAHQLRQELNRSHTLRRARLCARNLIRDFGEEGIFMSLPPNITCAVRLLDGFEATPSIEEAKVRLEAAAIQVDLFDESYSSYKGLGSSSHRQGPSSRSQTSHYGTCNKRPRPNPRPCEQLVRPAHMQPNPTDDPRHHINEIRRGGTQATSEPGEEIRDHEVPIDGT